MRLSLKQSGLSPTEYALLKALSTPIKIQDFLNTLPMNWEKEGDTHRSPRCVLRERKAHCIEGALLAATALWISGEKPLIMNLSPRMGKGDFDHVITIYKRGECYGALSKTNHATLRFRDPVYQTLHELAVSYFHEWFLGDTGEKVLECYSKPLDMRRFGTAWITAEEGLWEISDALSVAPHTYFVAKGGWKNVRNVDVIECNAGAIIEWLRSDPRT